MDLAQSNYLRFNMTYQECRNWPGKDQAAQEIGFTSGSRLIEFLKDNDIKEESFKTFYKHSLSSDLVKKSIDQRIVKSLVEYFDNQEIAIKNVVAYAIVNQNLTRAKSMKHMQTMITVLVFMAFAFLVNYAVKHDYI